MGSLSRIVAIVDLNKHPVFGQAQFQLLTLGDRALQRQLIESFIAQGSRNRADVLASAQAGAEQFAQVLHRLKGSCHFTAGERLLCLVRSIEGAKGLGSRRHRLVHAHAILSAVDDLEDALASFLAAGEAA